MMRSGVWCPEGCTVDSQAAAKLFVGGDGAALHNPKWQGWSNASWIRGTPARDGTSAGYQLSSLYALSLGWGTIASEWVKVCHDPQKLRNFINSWLAKTWEVIAREQTWEQVGRRIISDVARGIVPEWASLVTTGVDRQETHYVYMTIAWGPGRRGAILAYGTAPTLAEIRALSLERTWDHADGGTPLRLCFGLVDSGYRPDGIGEFCRQCIQARLPVWPSKGSNTALDSDFKRVVLGPHTSMPGMTLYHIDTIRSQLWIEAELDGGDEAHGLELYAGDLAGHQDVLEQLLNDAAVYELDGHNNARESWKRTNTKMPNDYRDCARNAYVAMLIACRGHDVPARNALPPRSAALPPPLTMDDGRPFLITER